MRTTIDAAGRLVVPKPLREAVRLRPGTEIEIRIVAGHIEIEPAPLPVRLERRGGLVVAVPVNRTRPLTTAEVDAAVDAVRVNRGTAARR